MKNVLASIFCLFSIVAMGQMVDVIEKPSGYFGKRLLVAFSGSFSASTNLQKGAEVLPDYFLTLNKDFSLNLQYTVKSNRSIGFIMGRGNTSFDPTYVDVGFGYAGLPITDATGKAFVIKRSIGSPIIKDFTIGFDYKMFRSNKGGFSPIGSYYNMGLVGHFYTIDQSLMSFGAIDKTNKEYIVQSNFEAIKTVLPEFFVGVGVSKPIFKSFLFDLGIKFGYLMTFQQNYYPSASTSYNELLEGEVLKKIRMREVLNFNAALAYPF
jgi:hypothetical protein